MRRNVEFDKGYTHQQESVPSWALRITLMFMFRDQRWLSLSPMMSFDELAEVPKGSMIMCSR